MDATPADVFRPVEYRRERSALDNVPLALLGIFAGLSLLVYLDLPSDLPGWIFILVGLGFIARALARLAFPARPILTLSPAGIAFHLRFLNNTLVPWHEVKDVAALDLTGPHGPPDRYPDVTALLISNEFYERHLLPKYRRWEKPLARTLYFLIGPTWQIRATALPGEEWELMFRPKGALMQMALPHPMLWFRIDPKDLRDPVEARWKAFRDRRGTSVPTTKAQPPRGAALVYGKWSPKLTRWQAVLIVVPLIGILAVLTNAIGVWDTPGLRAARDERAARIRRVEERRREQERYRDEFKRSNEAAEERERQSRERAREMNRMMMK
jgi:hypothetical protein